MKVFLEILAALILLTTSKPSLASAAGHLLTCYTESPNVGTSWILDVDRDADGIVHATIGTAYFWHRHPSQLPRSSIDHQFVVSANENDGVTEYEAPGFTLTVGDPQSRNDGLIQYNLALVAISQPIADGPNRDLRCSNFEDY